MSATEPVALGGAYRAVVCQMETENAVDRAALERNLDHLCEMVDWAVEGAMAMGAPVGLVVAPELSIHGAAGYSWSEQRRLACDIPGPETERLAEKAREYGIHLVPGSLLERDPDSDAIFNTLVLFGPDGELLWRYRKLNVWHPLEPTQSPVDLLDHGYDVERYPLLPVARTTIGNVGGLVCYDALFPEVTRQLAYDGAEVLVRASAFMDPWGSGPGGASLATDRVRALESMAYMVSCHQGASLRSSPPYSWTAPSAVIDFEGRVLAEAQVGERIVHARLDVASLREHRRSTLAFNVLAQGRHEAYDYLDRSPSPPRPELATANDLHVRDYERAATAGHEAFWSAYYGEPCRFPTLSAPFWRAQRERAERERAR
ncbi:nitrilase-related carbon-nitrogen hydrolase [Conexibacter woesei]|uniref:Nitrilase/cyanide hydratase and apolipoprotein N-acyltransferase n=1 Tax=Conexibacter woesei (strain DSM 14684 / CCUG 47730 / CIP 108061 / JCM 11494 / NBRC 100937 / ID131577) TaxID=469383 RepID=D3FA54_CONWI|nr:nitrilase-related carbon-nitrogen hydrolase [Conexibacter woesei]ADB53149.1 Nitrilase/cyanide hydratase and apolipoprotein N- acyltransferase [Conexibacter woesei DSM 14684]